jgi:hypothetical protein
MGGIVAICVIFFAIMAVFPNKERPKEMDTMLLRFCEHHYKEDHSADSLYETIEKTLDFYDKKNSVIFGFFWVIIQILIQDYRI